MIALKYHVGCYRNYIKLPNFYFNSFKVWTEIYLTMDLNSLKFFAEKVQFPLLGFTTLLQVRFKFALAYFGIFFRPIYVLNDSFTNETRVLH